MTIALISDIICKNIFGVYIMGNNELERLKQLEEKQKERYRKQNKHTNTLYDRISFTVPKGKKADVEIRAKEVGKSVNAYICDLVLDDLKRQEQNDDNLPDFMKD